MPKFQRISLVGSDELFRPTRVADVEPERQAEPEPEPAPPQRVDPADALAGRMSAQQLTPAIPEPGPVTPALTPLRDRHYHRMQLSTDQVKLLIDGLQKMKYPHLVHTDHKPSMEEFENLEAVRKALLDAIE